MRILPYLAVALCMALMGCSNQVNYTRSLFRNIPNDPQIIVLVRPNEVAHFAEKTIQDLDLNLEDMIDPSWNLDLDKVSAYKDVAIEMLNAVGIPWEKIESTGVMLYFEKPIILLTGDFRKHEVETKLKDLGFKQSETNGFFDYIYGGQKLWIPEDGVMMLAEEMLLDDMKSIPKDKTLWAAPEFSKYRLTSPLDHTIFVWSKPPTDMFPDLPYRDSLGNVSLSLDLKSGVSFKTVARLTDPGHTAALYDIVLGSVHLGRGIFGDVPVYGSTFQGLQVSQDNDNVVLTLTIPRDKAIALRQKIIQDLKNPDASTFSKFQKFFDNFP